MTAPSQNIGLRPYSYPPQSLNSAHSPFPVRKSYFEYISTKYQSDFSPQILNGKFVVAGFSSPVGDKDMNGYFRDFFGTPIVCRHLSVQMAGIQELLETGKSMPSRELRQKFNNICSKGIQNFYKIQANNSLSLRGFNSVFSVKNALENISHAKYLYFNESDKNNVLMTATEYLVFSFNKENSNKQINFPSFTEQLAAVINTIEPGQKERMLLMSEKHAMTLQISLKKNGIIKIRFFDPNFSFDTTHQLMPTYILMTNKENFEEITRAELEPFINSEIYFPKGHKTGVLARYGNVCKLNQKIQTQDIDELQNLISHQKNLGLDLENFPTQLEQLLKLNLEKFIKCGGLYCAIFYEYTPSIKIFTTFILESSLAPEEKVHVLKDIPPSYLIWKTNLSIASREVFMEAVFQSNLSSRQKLDVFLNFSGYPQLFEIILKSHFSQEKKSEYFMFLLNNFSGDKRVLFELRTHENIELVAIIVKSVLNSHLEYSLKLDFLAPTYLRKKLILKNETSAGMKKWRSNIVLLGEKDELLFQQLLEFFLLPVSIQGLPLPPSTSC